MNVDIYGDHGLSYRYSGGSIPQCAELMKLLFCHAVYGGIPAVFKHVGVCHDDGKQSNGISLILRRREFPLV